MKPAQPTLALKRAYDPPAASDGKRLLVERLWPRGIKKEALKADAWLRDVAPSTELRKWFSHDPEKWTEFQRRYRAELDKHPEAWQEILTAARAGKDCGSEGRGRTASRRRASRATRGGCY